MTTTAILGITIPDDTDLVKDGASAIRTVGNGFDAALAKLTLNAQTATYTVVLTDNRNKLVTMSMLLVLTIFLFQLTHQLLSLLDQLSM
jgi:hypothetical protein